MAGCDSHVEEKKEIASLTTAIEEIESNIDSLKDELDDAEDDASDAQRVCDAEKSEREKRASELKRLITEKVRDLRDVRPTRTGASGIRWKVAIENLSASNWTWNEEERTAVLDGRRNLIGKDDQFSYVVNPTALDTDVKVSKYQGYSAIEISCSRSAMCISYRGKRILTSGNKRLGSELVDRSDVNSRKSRNFWPVSSSHESGLVAQATSELIGLYKSALPLACGEVEKAKTRVSALETEVDSLKDRLADQKKDRRALEAQIR